MQINHRFSKLGQCVPDQIDKELREINKEATHVDVSRNELHILGETQLVKIIKSLTDPVTSVDLSSNQLHKLFADNLIATLKALGPNVKKVNLSSNGLGTFSAQDLQRILEAIPSTVESVDISGNNLGSYPKDQLKSILISLGKRKNINLSNNLLHLQKDDLPEVLKELDPSTQTVKLCGNKLGCLTDTSLVSAFKSLPLKLTRLDIGNNDLLENRYANTLHQCLRSLSKDLLVLDVAEFDSKFDSQSFITGLPGHIRAVGFNNTDEYFSWNDYTSPSINRIDKELALLYPYSATTGSYLVKSGVVQASDDKIKVLNELRQIFVTDLYKLKKGEESSIEALRAALREWSVAATPVLGTPRNNLAPITGLFSTKKQEKPSTYKMVNEIFTLLEVVSAPGEVLQY